MIEIQRAKLGLPPAGSPTPPIHSLSSARPSSQQRAVAVAQTPEQAAAATIRDEEALMQRFLHRLQRRDDSHPIADSSSGPTVPTALSRRMLQRQGVGYLDDTVAAIASASADRFLATVLQQAVACRDRRLEGAEMAREAARQRKRHMQQYQSDTDDRKRRKVERETARENTHFDAIAAAEALKKGGGAAKDCDDKKNKKKKKKVTVADSDEPGANGKKPEIPKGDGSDDESYDSIDEEEDYYQEQLGEVHGKILGEDEEDDEVLILRDLVRPLEAWKFHVTGKLGLEVRENETEEADVNDEVEGETENGGVQPEENGMEDGMFPDGMDVAKAENKLGDDSESGTVATNRKSAPSPAPNAAS